MECIKAKFLLAKYELKVSIIKLTYNEKNVFLMSTIEILHVIMQISIEQNIQMRLNVI